MANSPPKIAVFGDEITDVNCYGKILGISAETPTMVMRVEEEVRSPGGAGFVVSNLIGLGADTVNCVLPSGVIKSRYWVGGYKLFQTDHFTKPVCYDDFKEGYLGAITTFDIVIFSDYRHGVLTRSFVEEAIRECRERGVITMADSQVSQQPSNHEWYVGVDYLFVNGKEYDLLRASGVFCNLANIVIKKGAEGASILTRDNSVFHADGVPVNAMDTCGAGDCFLAAFATFHHLGDQDALRRANLWAAHSCTLQGTQVPKYADVFGEERPQ